MAGSGDSTHPAPRLTVDRMLAVITLVAVALVIGTLLPSMRSTEATPPPLGLYRLSQAERLVAFEDYTYGPGGWSGQRIDRRNTVLGPTLRPAQPTISRVFDLPEQAQGAVFVFDVIGPDVVDAFSIAVDPAASSIDVTEMAGQRRRFQINVAEPGGAVRLTLGVSVEDQPWALDNLLVVAHARQDAR